MRKSICVFLALLCVGGQFCACMNDSDSHENTNTDISQESPETEETKDPYDPELPEMDFNGHTFTFIMRGSEGGLYNQDIYAETITGEILNDTAYERNTALEEKCNISIAAEWAGDTGVSLTGSPMSKLISQAILSGDDTYGAILSAPYDTAGYMLSGYVMNLADFAYLNLSKSWWDQKAIQNLSFDGNIYFTTGEFSIDDNQVTYCTLFSKNMITDNNLEDPYQLVADGKWTLDILREHSEAVYADLNGDGVMNENDRYGYVYWQDAGITLLQGAGTCIGTVEADGTPSLSLYTERSVAAWEKMMQLLESPGCYSAHSAVNKLGNSHEAVLAAMLETDQLLYAFASIRGAITLRSCEADFGILPTPKYDETQEAYHSTPSGYSTTMLSVPITTQDSDRTGYILEAFCAKSAEIMTPAFYEVTLTGKTIRDTESKEMLDIIFSSKVYDVGYFFLWGDYANVIMNAWKSKNANFTSLYEKNQARAMTDMETCVGAFTQSSER